MTQQKIRFSPQKNYIRNNFYIFQEKLVDPRQSPFPQLQCDLKFPVALMTNNHFANRNLIQTCSIQRDDFTVLLI